MNANEVAECIQTLNDLWPFAGFTESELMLFGDTAMAYERGEIIDAMRSAKLASRERPQLADIFAPLRAATSRQRSGEVRACPGSPAAVYRAAGNGRYTLSQHDYEVVLRFHRDMWLNHALERESYRRITARKCAYDLIACGMFGAMDGTYADWAKRSAQIVFADSMTFEDELAVVLRDAPRADFAVGYSRQGGAA